MVETFFFETSELTNPNNAVGNPNKKKVVCAQKKPGYYCRLEQTRFAVKKTLKCVRNSQLNPYRRLENSGSPIGFPHLTDLTG